MNSGLRLALLLALVTGPHAAHAAEGTPSDAPTATNTVAPLLPAGSWTGTNQLWLRDPHHPFSSAATATVSATAAGTELRYTWSYEGAPQSGVMVLTEAGGAVHVTWTDTWHSPKEMTFDGRVTDGTIKVLGHYAAPHGPDWGWRIELTPSAAGPTMRMYNIRPHGREEIAVEQVTTTAG